MAAIRCVVFEQQKTELLDALEDIVTQNLRTISRCEDKMNNLVSDFLKLIEKDYVLYVQTTPAVGRYNLVTIFNSDVELLPSKIWDLKLTNPDHRIFRTLNDPALSSDLRNAAKVKFLDGIEKIKNLVSANLASTREKLEGLIYGILLWIEGRFKLCKYWQEYDMAIGFHRLWSDAVFMNFNISRQLLSINKITYSWGKNETR